MIREYDHGMLRTGLLAVAAVLAVAGGVRAETVIFRNECRTSVVVQTATVVKGMVVRDQPMLLRSGEYSTKVKTDTDKIVTVFDARSNQVLFRDTLKASGKEQGYSIQPDPKMMNKVRLFFRQPVTGKGAPMKGQ